MDNKLNEGEVLVNRVKLLMGYDMSKTLNENTHHIFEQPDSRFDTPETKNILKKGQEELDKKQVAKDAEEESKQYPNWCKYPDKALPYPPNPEGAEGDDAIIVDKKTGIRFCYYPTPSNNKPGNVSGLFIPENSEIYFWDIQGISNSVDFISKKYPKEKKETLIKNFSKIFPIGTVKEFLVGNVDYTSYITRTEGSDFWTFGYYRIRGTETPYTPPEWVDERSDYQRFIDKWGLYIQLGAAAVTLIAGFFTLGSTWGISNLLLIEIAVELGVGSAVAYREFEKGNNVSGTFSIITGMLPMLKLSKWFRGIDSKEFKILSDKIANSGLNKSSTVKDYVKFYNELTPDGKKIMDKLLSDDKITRDALWADIRTAMDSELPKIVDNMVPKLVSKNPKLLKDIKFFERLWFRELSTNLGVGVIAVLTELGFGDQLNNKEEKLDGVYQKTPKTLQKELTYNLINNPDKSGKIIDYCESKINENALRELSRPILKDSVEKSGGTYTELK